MALITGAELEALGRSPEGLKKDHLLQTSKATAELSIFLSHSHSDGPLVNGLRTLLGNVTPVRLYLDSDASDMPRVTDRQAAERVKASIAALDYFMILGTENALMSRWVPWEVGVAESIKPADRIILIPVADAEGKFRIAEYLQLYPVVEKSRDGRYAVFPPPGPVPGPRSGPALDKWLAARVKK